jgi:hypothetical protein
MTGDMPLDALVDRRAFLARAAVLAAATTAGTVVLPAISAAGTIRTQDGTTSSGLRHTAPRSACGHHRTDHCGGGHAHPGSAPASRTAGRGLPGSDSSIRRPVPGVQPGSGRGGARARPVSGVDAGARPAARNPAGHQGQLLHRRDHDDGELVHLRRLRPAVRRDDRRHAPGCRCHRAREDADGSAGHDPGHDARRDSHHRERMDADEPVGQPGGVRRRAPRRRWRDGWRRPVSGRRRAARSRRRRMRRT